MFCDFIKNKSINVRGFQVPLGGFRGKPDWRKQTFLSADIISPAKTRKVKLTLTIVKIPLMAVL